MIDATNKIKESYEHLKAKEKFYREFAANAGETAFDPANLKTELANFEDSDTDDEGLCGKKPNDMEGVKTLRSLSKIDDYVALLTGSRKEDT